MRVQIVLACWAFASVAMAAGDVLGHGMGMGGGGGGPPASVTPTNRPTPQPPPQIPTRPPNQVRPPGPTEDGPGPGDNLAIGIAAERARLQQEIQRAEFQLNTADDEEYRIIQAYSREIDRLQGMVDDLGGKNMFFMIQRDQDDLAGMRRPHADLNKQMYETDMPYEKFAALQKERDALAGAIIAQADDLARLQKSYEAVTARGDAQWKAGKAEADSRRDSKLADLDARRAEAASRLKGAKAELAELDSSFPGAVSPTGQ